jgi:hypothetical protein
MSKQENQGGERVVPAAISGFRLFQIGPRPMRCPGKEWGQPSQLTLKSLYQSSDWKVGENRAFCIFNSIYNRDLERDPTKCFISGGDVPEKDCHCGLQAYYDLELDLVLEPSFFDRYAIASIAGAGKVLMHRHGFRSEKSQVTGLFLPDYSEFVDDEGITEIEAQQLRVAEFYKINIFKNKECFLENAKKYGQLINPKRDRQFMPRKGDLFKSYYSPNSLDDEIEIHGGDCSLKILNSITDNNYKFEDYPRSLLVKKSLFRSFAWSSGFGRSRLKDTNNLFYKSSSQLIKKSTPKNTLRLARFLDSNSQYVLLGLVVLFLSILLNLKMLSFVPEFMQSFMVLFVLVSMISLIRFSRKKLRRKLINPVNNNLNNKN